MYGGVPNTHTHAHTHTHTHARTHTYMWVSAIAEARFQVPSYHRRTLPVTICSAFLPHQNQLKNKRRTRMKKDWRDKDAEQELSCFPNSHCEEEWQEIQMGDQKPTKLDVMSTVKEKVFWLDVSVNDLLLVATVHSITYFQQHLENNLRLKLGRNVAHSLRNPHKTNIHWDENFFPRLIGFFSVDKQQRWQQHEKSYLLIDQATFSLTTHNCAWSTP